MRLLDFEGAWTIERKITDGRTGRPGRLDGVARFIPDAAGLAYVEEGLLTLGDGPALTASRRYLWRDAGAQTIEVRFADGRFFHSFRTDDPTPAAEHDCPPDRYHARYDFRAWPCWTAEWRAAGPHKDYVLLTRYRPGG